MLLKPRILKKESDLVVVDKPPFWLSVPGTPGPSAPFFSDIKSWLCDELQLPQVFPVHRLDLETSGVLIFALHAEAQSALSGAWARHQVRKKYFVLARGKAPMSLFRVNREVRGKSAATQFEVIQQYSETLSLWAHPLTGRRHQIRIHLASEGSPVLFDPQYGPKHDRSFEKSPEELKPRLALHSFSIQLPDGRKYESAIPDDIQNFEKVVCTP